MLSAAIPAGAAGFFSRRATRAVLPVASAAIAASHNLQVSAHCAPALHVPVAASVTNLRHLEYFIDHTRLEPKLFDGIPAASNGELAPDTTSPGHGMSIATGAERYRR